jgi:hypothetical protein
MELKCVGGPNDGLVQTVPGKYRIGDVWRVAQPPKEMLLLDYPTDHADKPPHTEYVEYALDYVRFNHETAYFLRYLPMSTQEAVLHQFSK